MTMREWLEERQTKGQLLSHSLASPYTVMESAGPLLERLQSGAYADELDAPVVEVIAREIWRAYGKIAHIARTEHIALVYATDEEEDTQP